MKLGPTLDWTCDCKQTQLQPSSSSGSCIIATFNCSGPRKISQGDLDDYCKVRPGCFNLKAVWLRTMIMLVSLCHGACLSVLMNGWELGSEESVMNKPIAWEYLILKSMQAGRARWVCIRDRYYPLLVPNPNQLCAWGRQFAWYWPVHDGCRHHLHYSAAGCQAHMWAGGARI